MKRERTENETSWKVNANIIYNELIDFLIDDGKEDCYELIKRNHILKQKNISIVKDKIDRVLKLDNYHFNSVPLEEMLEYDIMPHLSFLFGVLYLYSATLFSYSGRYTGYESYYLPPWLVRVAIYGDIKFKGIKDIISKYNQSVEVKILNFKKLESEVNGESLKMQ